MSMFNPRCWSWLGFHMENRGFSLFKNTIYQDSICSSELYFVLTYPKSKFTPSHISQLAFEFCARNPKVYFSWKDWKKLTSFIKGFFHWTFLLSWGLVWLAKWSHCFSPVTFPMTWTLGSNPAWGPVVWGSTWCLCLPYPTGDFQT